ncbi:DUF4433 domain-containing protein [Phyllobacterium sp. P30BS-XVII]|uniref:type II toxin-antitoxin system toxin DNA ADP-ribosyl transferase DarT n=1 Tax=Phyllobacterium sp. P30BS-XVII TaxID=2587046 RepID=UPI0018499AFB|nr:DUF4433 domain-containing protein [Phyllobacterium sp. P30BS-XVII]MBA8903734.1 hypothetical protein [Phyllobacterium sp. P30BS-XVII]
MNINLTQEKALIFRIVHKDNIAKTLGNGCHCKATMNGQNYTAIGNPELIVKRDMREVPCAPGGTLSDYVPFYFTPCSPMLYNIKTGFSGITKRPMEDIMILVSSLPHLVEHKIPFVFTDRHAYLRTAQFSSSLVDLGWIIWPTLQAKNFKRDDADKFEKYQAEALVHKHVPLGALLGIACYNANVKAVVEAEAKKHNAEIKVVVQREWFF